MKKLIINFLFLTINILFYSFFKKELVADFVSKDLYVLVPIILLALILSKAKYFLWSVLFISGSSIILYGNTLAQQSTCANIGCGINIYALYVPIALLGVTILLLLIQLIQFIIKRSRAKNAPMVDARNTNIFR